LTCPTCPDHELDTREMFLKGNNAVVLCGLCGREFVLASELKCNQKGCSNPVTDLICSKYTNVSEPVACFCDQHKPRGFRRWFWYHLMGNGQDVVPFISSAVRGKCVKCGDEISCSNKYMFTRCAACGKHYYEKVHFFGPSTLEPTTIEEGATITKQSAAVKSSSDDSDYERVVAEQLFLSESEQFAIECPYCGRKHLWNEIRTRGNEEENLLQVIMMMRKAEDVSLNLGMSNMLNRSQGWFCTQCGETIHHDYLLKCLAYRR